MPSSSNVYLLALVVIVAIAFLIASKARAARIQNTPRREISLQEQKANEEELWQLLQAGKKIDAIKRYRELYQTGLKEAKDAVEMIEKSHGA